MKTLVQLKALNRWGGVTASNTVEIDSDSVPTIFEMNPPENPPRKFRLSKVDHIKANMYRALYVQEPVKR